MTHKDIGQKSLCSTYAKYTRGWGWGEAMQEITYITMKAA